jgi:hypothetical protein
MACPKCGSTEVSYENQGLVTKWFKKYRLHKCFCQRWHTSEDACGHIWLELTPYVSREDFLKQLRKQCKD